MTRLVRAAFATWDATRATEMVVARREKDIGTLEERAEYEIEYEGILKMFCLNDHLLYFLLTDLQGSTRRSIPGAEFVPKHRLNGGIYLQYRNNVTG